MLGRRGRCRRVAKLRRGAEPQLEPGEAVEEVVQVQTGQSALANAGAVVTAYSRGAGLYQGGATELNAGPYVLLATDRHIYILRLGGARLLDVGEVVHKVPLSEADVRLEGGKLKLGAETFHVLWGFGARAERLAAHVEGERQPSAASTEQRSGSPPA